MSWVKLSDDLWANAKLLGVSKAARWLFVASIAYSRHEQLAGFVPAAAMRMLLEGAPHKLVDELIAQRLIARAEGGYSIPSYEEYNPLTSAERTRNWRERQREKSSSGDRADASRTVTEPSPRDAAVTSPRRRLTRAPATGRDSDLLVSHDPVPEPVPELVGTSNARSRANGHARASDEALRETGIHATERRRTAILDWFGERKGWSTYSPEVFKVEREHALTLARMRLPDVQLLVILQRLWDATDADDRPATLRYFVGHEAFEEALRNSPRNTTSLERVGDLPGRGRVA